MTGTEHISIHSKYEMIEGEFKRVDRALSKQNADLLKAFYEKHYLKENLSNSRAVKSVMTLRVFAEFTGKPLDCIKEREIEAYNIKLVKDKKSLFTIVDFRKILKCWLRFLGEKKHWNLIHSPELKCKNPYSNGNTVLLPSDLPTDEEVLQIFKVASPRLRCLLALCEGAGFRASEGATMRIADVKFNENGCAHVTARQSKSKTKTVLIRADLSHYIKAWINSLADQSENCLLFPDPKNSKQAIQYATHRKELLKIGKQLGLLEKRKFTFHIFRHRHASWALANMTPVMAKMRIWNNKTSRMDGVYGTFANKQVDEEFLRANGDLIEEKKKDVFKAHSRLCYKCQQIYPQTVMVCPKCDIPLTQEGLKEFQDAQVKSVVLDTFCEILGQDKVNELFSAMAKKIQASGIEIKKIKA